jgi:hypothetical protein
VEKPDALAPSHNSLPFSSDRGPHFQRFRRYRGSGFRDVEQHETLTPRTSNVEMPTRLDLAPHVLWMDDCYSPLHTMGAIYCVNFGATSLFTISRQPLICSYGWIWTVDTIILPASLILSLKRTFSVRCAWALLVQPADLDIPMPKTRIVANK